MPPMGADPIVSRMFHRAPSPLAGSLNTSHRATSARKSGNRDGSLTTDQIASRGAAIRARCSTRISVANF
jgi:hypothetical protein